MSFRSASVAGISVHLLYWHYAGEHRLLLMLSIRCRFLRISDKRQQIHSQDIGRTIFRTTYHTPIMETIPIRHMQRKVYHLSPQPPYTMAIHIACYIRRTTETTRIIQGTTTQIRSLKTTIVMVICSLPPAWQRIVTITMQMRQWNKTGERKLQFSPRSSHDFLFSYTGSRSQSPRSRAKWDPNLRRTETSKALSLSQLRAINFFNITKFALKCFNMPLQWRNCKIRKFLATLSPSKPQPRLMKRGPRRRKRRRRKQRKRKRSQATPTMKPIMMNQTKKRIKKTLDLVEIKCPGHVHKIHAFHLFLF